MTTVTAYVKKLFKKLSRFCLNYSEERGIPTGSGPYRVGMVDVLTEQLCGVNGRIFYPIEPAEDDPSRYVQWFSRAEYAYGFAGFAGLSAKRFGPVLNWIFNKYTVPATYGAKIINSEKMEKIPVLIFSHGLGGTKQCYSTVCCELSSQGFIVGAVEHRDGSASFSYSVESFLRRGNKHPCESDIDSGITYVYMVDSGVPKTQDKDVTKPDLTTDSDCKHQSHVCARLNKVGTCVDSGKALMVSSLEKSQIAISSDGSVTLKRVQSRLQNRSSALTGPVIKCAKSFSDGGPENLFFATPDFFLLKEKLVPFKIAKKGEDEFILRNNQIHLRGNQCIEMLDLLLLLHLGHAVYDIHNTTSTEAGGESVDSDRHFQQFQGRLDMTRVAVVGHSFGGGTSVCALAKDKRFKCAIALDAWMQPLERELISNVEQPVLFVNSDKFQWPMNLVKMKKMENVRRTIDRIMLFLRGTVHQSQGDFPFLLPPLFSRILEVRGKTDPKIAMELSNRISLAFLRKQLDIPDPTDWWGLLEGKDERVIVGTNAPLRRRSEIASGSLSVA